MSLSWWRPVKYKLFQLVIVWSWPDFGQVIYISDKNHVFATVFPKDYLNARAPSQNIRISSDDPDHVADLRAANLTKPESPSPFSIETLTPSSHLNSIKSQKHTIKSPRGAELNAAEFLCLKMRDRLNKNAGKLELPRKNHHYPLLRTIFNKSK